MINHLLNYARQANQPSWFGEDEDHFYHAVTSGTSPWNEWYEFASEEDALDFALTFESQSVIDHFYRVTVDGKRRWYHNDDVGLHTHWTDSSPIEEGTPPASFADLAQAESRF